MDFMVTPLFILWKETTTEYRVKNNNNTDKWVLDSRKP